MKRSLILPLLTAFGILPFLAGAQLTVATFPATGLNEPYALAQDEGYNVYFSDSANNTILKIDANSQAVTVFAGSETPGNVDGPAYAAQFSDPQGLVYATIAGTNGLIVADTVNGTIRFIRISDGYVSTLAGNTNGLLVDSSIGRNATFSYPYGLTSDNNGNIYIADWGNAAIRVLNLNDPNFGVTTLAVTNTAFNLRQPQSVAYAGTNQLWVADTGNHTLRLVTLSSAATGSQTTYLGGMSSRNSGTADSALGSNARFDLPGGLLWDAAAGLLISDTGNHTIRLATNNPVLGATNYSVSTFAGTPLVAGSTNGNALSATFSSPYGMVKDIPNGRYLLADAANHALRIIQYGAVLGPCPPPSIGYITFEYDASLSEYVSVLNTDPPFTFNNDVPIGISYPAGYNAAFTQDGTTPTRQSSAPNQYHSIISTLQIPTVSIQLDYYASNVQLSALVWNNGQPTSPITNATFHFATATPQILGQNSAQFQVSCLTSNALLYYTTDGSDPSSSTTSSTAAFNPTNSLTTPFHFGGSNFWFTCLARRSDATHRYADSTLVSNYFAMSNNLPNLITFGVTNGAPHSSFITRPGQYYYAPVTLQMLPNFGKMYSLQFNVSVTNGFTNILTGKAIPPIVNGAGIAFESMLMTRVSSTEGLFYPPADAHWYLPLRPLLSQVTLGFATNYYDSTFVNTNNNLLGIGWLFRTGFSYFYMDSIGDILLDFDTTAQDLITYSVGHDILFPKSGGLILVGAYSFQIPSNSVTGDQFFMQLGSPSATSDGVGAPGAGITIQPPVNSQAVTVGSPSYLVGDTAPFRWFNAGDFGDGNLDNSDVMQIYQSGVLGVDVPPANSDLFAAMDSSGGWGAFDKAHGYYTNSGTAFVNQQQAMWDGNDSTINTNAFGDGVLDINDLYITFRRSLDPSLVWFERLWTNGMFVAVTTTNYASNNNTPNASHFGSAMQPKTTTTAKPNYLNSAVAFGAGDAVADAGSVVQIPITANVLGNYPVRVLGLNVTVHPLDGSPDLSNSVSFAISSGLGTPSLAPGAKSPDNFNAAWLDATIGGLSNNATIGTLMVTVPTNATSSSAYAVHFDFASGSPNGLAVFPKTTTSGLITTTLRTNSSFGDGIPDSWRLRWFGTIYNVLSASNACPSGDGVPNWKKYIAGVDPNIPNDFPSVNAAPVPAGSTTAIHWPSVYGKQYVIQRASSLYDSPWTILSTNTGTGGDLEYDDTSTANVKFYRVEILP